MTRLNESNYPQEVYRTKQTKLPKRLNLEETSVKVIEIHVKKHRIQRGHRSLDPGEVSAPNAPSLP